MSILLLERTSLPRLPASPPRRMVTGIDLSWSRLTPEAAHCLREQGIELVIVGIRQFDPELTEHNLRVARDHFPHVQAYVYLYWNDDTEERARLSVKQVQPWASRLWLDAEDSYRGWTPRELEEKIGAAVRGCGDLPCGIYTGRWWWVPATGNTDAFSYLPLWHSHYGIEPSLELADPYGGWTRCAMHQYRGTHDVCGLSVDANIAEV